MSALGADQRLRYARQLLVPEIGLAGQERLCAARVAVPPALASWAAPYLAGAGLAVSSAGSNANWESNSVDAPSLASPLADVPSTPVASAIAGSWFAVETIKRELGLALASPDALPRAIADLERTLDGPEGTQP